MQSRRRKLMAYKYNCNTPVEWHLRRDGRVIFHRIDSEGTVETPDGPMVVVRITHNTEIAQPDCDIAALVGQAVAYRKSKHIDPQSPELWFWEDKFWVKARSTDGSAYYNNKAYLFYEVEVERTEELMAAIVTGFEAKVNGTDNP